MMTYKKKPNSPIQRIFQESLPSLITSLPKISQNDRIPFRTSFSLKTELFLSERAIFELLFLSSYFELFRAIFELFRAISSYFELKSTFLSSKNTKMLPFNTNPLLHCKKIVIIMPHPCRLPRDMLTTTIFNSSLCISRVLFFCMLIFFPCSIYKICKAIIRTLIIRTFMQQNARKK